MDNGEERKGPVLPGWHSPMTLVKKPSPKRFEETPRQRMFGRAEDLSAVRAAGAESCYNTFA